MCDISPIKNKYSSCSPQQHVQPQLEEQFFVCMDPQPGIPSLPPTALSQHLSIQEAFRIIHLLNQVSGVHGSKVNSGEKTDTDSSD